MRLADDPTKIQSRPNSSAAPAALVLLQFVLLAKGKPAEYARFALPADMILAIAAAGAVAAVRWRWLAGSLAVLLVVCVAVSSLRYIGNYVGNVSREVIATFITHFQESETGICRDGRARAILLTARSICSKRNSSCYPKVTVMNWISMR